MLAFKKFNISTYKLVPACSQSLSADPRIPSRSKNRFRDLAAKGVLSLSAAATNGWMGLRIVSIDGYEGTGHED